jgi:hypothetical protein
MTRKNEKNRTYTIVLKDYYPYKAITQVKEELGLDKYEKAIAIIMSVFWSSMREHPEQVCIDPTTGEIVLNIRGGEESA